MSASETNVEKQVKRHKGPLTGFVAVIAWAAVLLAGFLLWTAYQSGNPTAESPAEVISDEG